MAKLEAPLIPFMPLLIKGNPRKMHCLAGGIHLSKKRDPCPGQLTIWVMQAISTSLSPLTPDFSERVEKMVGCRSEDLGLGRLVGKTES